MRQPKLEEAMPKHVDYTNGVLLVDSSMLDPELKGLVEMPILGAGYTDCDFCTKANAVYEIDAESALGEGGQNTFYCQKCASAASQTPGAPDVWLAKDTFRMVETIVWEGEYDPSEFSVLHTAEYDVNGRPNYIRVVEYLPYAQA
jgi:hypothetical protein